MLTKITLAAVALLGIMTSQFYLRPAEQTVSQIFEDWMRSHGRTYSSIEKSYRFMVFKQNYMMISEHNREHRQGLYSYSMAVNNFADLTQQEYKITHLTSVNFDKKSITTYCNGTIADNLNPPADWDWTNKATTDVQIEGSCGASWAFSATGALEGAYALSRGRILKLSDQQLIDCSADYGNNGCDGGYMDQGFWYVIDNGITLAENYPYSAKKSKCIYKSSMKYFRVTECVEVHPRNYSKLITAVLEAPVAVAVDATTFRFYNDGVFDRSCDTDLNRGMLLVGYGTLNGKDYWNLKNSQGVDWGRKGYMLLYRDKADGNGQCGIQMTNFIPKNVVI